MNPPNGDTFLDLVRDTLASDALLPPGARVLVACSGGGDSMALLHALHRLGYAVTVAHLDHASRPESANDAAWLREQVVTLGLPFESARHPVAEEASSLGVSFEAHARTVRYAFLVRTARRLECDAIATGHTGSDQAETVLLRLVRGSGPAGLGGIPPLGNHGGVPVARPLLRVSRDAVRAWLVSQDIAWLEDASNDDDTILRNRIRHRLLPLLRDEFNDQIDQSLARLADICREEEAWLRPQAAEAWVACIDAQARISRERFAALPGALQRRGVVAFLQESDVETSYDQVTLLVDFIRSAPVGARHCLPGGGLLYAGRDWVECVNLADEDEEEVQLPVPGSITAFGRHFLTRRIDVPALETLASRCTPTRQCFDADALGDHLIIRLRRPGDRITPFGAPGSRKVSDIMVDAGVPAPRRAQVPLLLSGDTIVWIAGGPVSQTVAITAQTRAAVEVEIMDAPQFPAPH